MQNDTSSTANCVPSSARQRAPRIVHGLFFGSNAAEDGWQPLPASLVETVDESRAQEDILRCRYSLPPSDFSEPIARDEAHWDEKGALRAVQNEMERLKQRPRDEERDNASVGYARDYGFYFGVVHFNDDERAARMMLDEQMRQPSSNCAAATAAAAASCDDQIEQRDMHVADDLSDVTVLGNARDERVEQEEITEAGFVDDSTVDVMQGGTPGASLNSCGQRSTFTRVTSRRETRVLGVPIAADAIRDDNIAADNVSPSSGNAAEVIETTEDNAVSGLQRDIEEEISDDEEEITDESFSVVNCPNLQRNHAKVLNKLYELLVDLRKSLPSADNTRLDLLVQKRVAGCGLAVGYQGAVAGPNGLRTLAIYLDLPPKIRLATTRIACVRFMSSNRIDDDGSLVDSERISTCCSCSSTIGAAACEHAELIATYSFKIRNEIQFILSYKSRRLLSETPSECSALLLGERKKNSKAAWLIMRHNALNELTVNCVPVMESAAAKRSGQPIERRVTCKKCRFGSCEHEEAVVKAVKALDAENPEGNNDDEPSYRVNRYQSVLPRRLFTCRSDKEELRKLGNAVNI